MYHGFRKLASTSSLLLVWCKSCHPHRLLHLTDENISTESQASALLAPIIFGRSTTTTTRHGRGFLCLYGRCSNATSQSFSLAHPHCEHSFVATLAQPSAALLAPRDLAAKPMVMVKSSRTTPLGKITRGSDPTAFHWTASRRAKCSSMWRTGRAKTRWKRPGTFIKKRARA